MDISEVISVLKPNSELELKIISTPEYLLGVDFGKPRPGHPEGKVLYHIREVLDNVDTLPVRCSPNRRMNLRLISLVHDAFKYKVDKSMPLRKDNNHGDLARQYLEKFYYDESAFKVIETHDDAFNIWNSANKSGKWEKAENRAKALITHLGCDFDLYLAFFKCDNATGDKSQIPYDWFLSQYFSTMSNNYS